MGNNRGVKMVNHSMDHLFQKYETIYGGKYLGIKKIIVRHKYNISITLQFLCYVVWTDPKTEKIKISAQTLSQTSYEILLTFIP